MLRPDDFFLRNVGHMAFPEEWQQVVLAQAVELDVFDDDHFVVTDVEHGAVQQFVGILAVAAGKKTQRFLETLGRAAQSFAVGIFAQLHEHLADQLGNFSGDRLRDYDFCCFTHV